jgi:hypothetical protein
MTQPTGIKPELNTAMNCTLNRPNGLVFGIVCPSVCLSDWDKQKTLVTKCCVATGYDERLKKERRGQESLNARPLLFHVCSKRLCSNELRRHHTQRILANFACFSSRSATKPLQSSCGETPIYCARDSNQNDGPTIKETAVASNKVLPRDRVSMIFDSPQETGLETGKLKGTKKSLLRWTLSATPSAIGVG